MAAPKGVGKCSRARPLTSGASRKLKSKARTIGIKTDRAMYRVPNTARRKSPLRAMEQVSRDPLRKVASSARCGWGSSSESAVVESQFVSIATPCIISSDTNFSEGLLAFGSTGLLGQRSTAGIEFGSKKAAIMASLEATIP
jgi:hypothetical protein